MRIDSLKQSEHDPNIHGKDVQVTRQRAPQDRAADSAKTEHHDFDRGSIFRGQTEWRTVLVVDLVDHLIQAWRMQSSV